MDESPIATAPNSSQSLDRELAIAAFRFAMGVNVFMHGAVRIFGDLNGFVSGTVKGFQNTILPAPLVQIYAYGLSFAELGLGALLIVGLWTRPVLVSLILVMSSLMFGMSLRQEWETVGLQVVYAIAFFLLLFFNRPNRFSLDGLLRRGR